MSDDREPPTSMANVPADVRVQDDPTPGQLAHRAYVMAAPSDIDFPVWGSLDAWEREACEAAGAAVRDRAESDREQLTVRIAELESALARALAGRESALPDDRFAAANAALLDANRELGEALTAERTHNDRLRRECRDLAATAGSARAEADRLRGELEQLHAVQGHAAQENPIPNGGTTL